MPVFDDDKDMESHLIRGSNYGFSAKRISQETLGASAYSLVNIAVDRSGSVCAFQREIEDAIKEIVRSCQHSKRVDNLMLRVTTFDSNLTEVHGFKPLAECNPDDYTGCARPGGTTALYDAAENGIQSVSRYGKDLYDQDYTVNAITFIITDGDNNASTATAKSVGNAINAAIQGECLESLNTVLIGVNITDPHMSQRLSEFRNDAGITQYVEIDNANAKSLAKLAHFVSESISSTSQHLGSGGPSQSLTF